MTKWIIPKDFLWSGEDNTSPAIERLPGKNVDEYKLYYFTAAIATVPEAGSVDLFSLAE